MNLKQDLQQMFAAQQLMIQKAFEQLNCDIQQESAKLQESIGQLQLSVKWIEEQLQPAKSNNEEKPIVSDNEQKNLSEKLLDGPTPSATLIVEAASENVEPTTSAGKPAMNQHSVEIEPDKVGVPPVSVMNPQVHIGEEEVKPKPYDATERKKVFEIMCLLLDKKKPRYGGFESDSSFKSIMFKLDNDIKFYNCNGYNVHNKNVSIIQELFKLWRNQKMYHERRKSDPLYASEEETNEEELAEIEQMLVKIGQILKYPIRLDDVFQDSVFESSAFDRNSKNFVKYIAMVCTMWKCKEALDMRFISNRSRFLDYWLATD